MAMSIARATFLKEIDALAQAVLIPNVGSPTALVVRPGVSILRRGAAITGLVILETFVRARTEEVLIELQNWPARYEDLPTKFRDRATIEALPHLEKYARMLRKQQNDYESEIISEVTRMASVTPPAFQFTKFISGDYTGNISDSSLKELLGVFRIEDCWNGLHHLSTDIGFGVPSVKEVLRSMVANRHRSAHASNFTPTVGDMEELPHNLRLIGICIDTALSASVRTALSDWTTWVSAGYDWKSKLEIYFVKKHKTKFRVMRKDRKRAVRIICNFSDTRRFLPKGLIGGTRLLVRHGNDGRPLEWDIA